MQFTLDFDEYDRKLLDRAPVGVFVCNRLLPGVDERILLQLLAERAGGFKIMHPYMTPPPKGLRPYLFSEPKKPLADRLLPSNFAKKLAARVRRGESVGLVLDFSENPLGNLEKNLFRPEIIRQLRKAGVPVTPIHLSAEHLPGGLLRRIFPMLPFSPGQPVRVNVRVGSPVLPDDVAAFPRSGLFGKFLQAKIFSLGSPFDVNPELFTDKKTDDRQLLAEPTDPVLVEVDIAALRPEQKLCSRGSFDVFVAPFLALPNAMFEIARLRELTFREAGEGTGKPRDMDEYDLYYQQLIIWDRDARRIVGGYRVGEGDLIFRRFGMNGFYISSLFKIKPGFFPVLQQAVELGRSYVVPDYQKHRLPLFLLWKGILHFLLAHPQYRFIQGPVSISKYYSEVSKSLIVEFVRQYFFDEKLARWVKPRKPFRFKSRDVDAKLLVETLKGQFENLENFVEDIEPAHFKVPVLFRQYLKQNARFIAFNVDPNFSDCLDGLMILDIQNLPASTLEALSQEK